MAPGPRTWAVVGVAAVLGATAVTVPALRVEPASADLGGAVRLTPAPPQGASTAATATATPSPTSVTSPPATVVEPPRVPRTPRAIQPAPPQSADSPDTADSPS